MKNITSYEAARKELNLISNGLGRTIALVAAARAIKTPRSCSKCGLWGHTKKTCASRSH